MDLEEIVCLSLVNLWKFLSKDDYDENYRETALGYAIRRDRDYYDLYNSDDLRICCDGEQCKVINKTNRYVELIDVENIDNEDLVGIDTTFKLSIGEFGVATFARS